ncbi:MAG: hypothetical protein GKR94_22400 [Gammaproteobacteria bacterium]|nr:hypothetical protein [Gammaproteobacteria bacterium]
MGKLSEAIRLRHYSIRTEQAHCGWVRRFLYRARRLALAALSAWHARRLLPDLVTQRAVAPATQNQALNAIVFLLPAHLGAGFDGCTTRFAERAHASAHPSCIDFSRSGADARPIGSPALVGGVIVIRQ